MKAAGFEFRDNARFQPGAHRDADAVGRRLEALKVDGELTPTTVLDDARHPSSPLHSFFEWTDTTAAHEFRLSQARSLIRAVVAVYEDENDKQREPVRVVAFTHIEGVGEPHYRNTVDALSEQETRAAVLRRALTEANAWRARYRELSELAQVFTALEQTGDLFRQREG